MHLYTAWPKTRGRSCPNCILKTLIKHCALIYFDDIFHISQRCNTSPLFHIEWTTGNKRDTLQFLKALPKRKKEKKLNTGRRKASFSATMTENIFASYLKTLAVSVMDTGGRGGKLFFFLSLRERCKSVFSENLQADPWYWIGVCFCKVCKSTPQAGFHFLNWKNDFSKEAWQKFTPSRCAAVAIRYR